VSGAARARRATAFEQWQEPPPLSTVLCSAGLSFGYWTGNASTEAVASAPLDEWLLSIALTPLDLVLWHEGRKRFDGIVPEGSAEILAPGVTPRALVRSAFRYCRLSVPLAVLEQMIAEGEIDASARLQPRDYSGAGILAELGLGIARALRADHPASRLETDALVRALLARMIGWAGGGGVSSFSPSPQCDWRLRRAIEYLELHLADDIGIADLAGVIGLGTSHVGSLFRAGTGEPPHRWLMRRRFERACEMLADPHHSVTEVAHACGFASSQHLATVFRKRLGVTPSAFRRERAS
jgi:AraC family transcriptional regulator